MIAVLDANVGLEIARRGPEAQSLIAAIEACAKSLAPCFYRTEVANALRTLAANGLVEKAQASELYATITGLVDEFTDDALLMVESLHEGIRLNHAVYDMLYLVLARRSGGTIITLDKRLARLCAQEGLCVYFDAGR